MQPSAHKPFFLQIIRTMKEACEVVSGNGSSASSRLPAHILTTEFFGTKFPSSFGLFLYPIVPALCNKRHLASSWTWPGTSPLFCRWFGILFYFFKLITEDLFLPFCLLWFFWGRGAAGDVVSPRRSFPQPGRCLNVASIREDSALRVSSWDIARVHNIHRAHIF